MGPSILHSMGFHSNPHSRAASPSSPMAEQRQQTRPGARTGTAREKKRIDGSCSWFKLYISHQNNQKHAQGYFMRTILNDVFGVNSTEDVTSDNEDQSTG